LVKFNFVAIFSYENPLENEYTASLCFRNS
ncbi:MAG: hypothetical protein ACI8QY_001100, partial [bacterium]